MPHCSFILGTRLVPTSHLSLNGASGRCCPWPPHRGLAHTACSHGTHVPFTAFAMTGSFRLALTRLITIFPGRHVAFGSVSVSSARHHHGIQHPSIMDHKPGARPSAAPTFSHVVLTKPLRSSRLSAHLHIKTLRCPRGRPGRAPTGMNPQSSNHGAGLLSLTSCSTRAC